MKQTILILLVFFALFSCKKNDTILLAENYKDLKKKEIIFANINKSWFFNAKPTNATSQDLTTTWTEWRIFLDELSKKPKTTIGAFQQKAKNLSKKAVDLSINIPEKFNNQAIISRIMVLQTKINMLELYINLFQIPDAKVIQMITAVKTEVAAIQNQMNEIEIKSKIKIEDGEQDLMMMLDTTRAVPTVLPVQ